MSLSEQEHDMLATYNAERARGIVHTPRWAAYMVKLQIRFDEDQVAKAAEHGEVVLMPGGGYLIVPEALKDDIEVMEFVESQHRAVPHSMTPVAEWWAGQWTDRVPGFTAGEGLFWGFLVGAVIFVVWLLYSTIF